MTIPSGRALLDVNVLIALLDADHVDHVRARRWLGVAVRTGWATCAITQNGFVRIVSQPRYPSPVSPAAALDVLTRACAVPGHDFWPCEVSVLDVVDHERVHDARQVTDAYLLALAVHHGGALVTFDRSVSLAAVPGARPDQLIVLSPEATHHVTYL